MAINFPNSPAVNDEFVVGSTTYTWDGTTWNTLGIKGVAVTTQASYTPYTSGSSYYVDVKNNDEDRVTIYVSDDDFITASGMYINSGSTITVGPNADLNMGDSSFSGGWYMRVQAADKEYAAATGPYNIGTDI